jgi:hypothetical protein
MLKTVISPSLHWLCALAIALLISGGCGGDRLDRRRIQGTVTFEGKPVQRGAVLLEPTRSVGTIAPTVYLRVQDGKFDTGDEGPIPGKYKVIVGGYDLAQKQVDDDGVTHTAQLFNDYSFEVEVPPPGNTLDIEVPASQAIQKE